MAKCESCGAELKENAEFCGKCGKAVVQKKRCEKCGAELAEGVKFCLKCGTPAEKPKVLCKKCGAELPEGAEFCGNCGAMTEQKEAEMRAEQQRKEAEVRAEKERQEEEARRKEAKAKAEAERKAAEELAEKKRQEEKVRRKEAKVKAAVERKAAEELEEKQMQEANAYINSGHGYYKNGCYDQAIEEYTKAVELYPAPVNYTIRADAYYAKGDYESAIADYTRVIDMNPNVKYFNSRGDAYFAKEDYANALADYINAVCPDPHSYYPLKNPKGTSFYRTISALQSIIRSNPDNGPYKTLLERVSQAFVKTLSTDDKASIMQELCQEGIYLHKESKYYGMAVEEYTRALILDPQDAYCLYLRGKAYEAWGKNAEALADYEKSREIAPDLEIPGEKKGLFREPTREERIEKLRKKLDK
jgi:tetratricopeptide (TPR) repeat protein